MSRRKPPSSTARRSLNRRRQRTPSFRERIQKAHHRAQDQANLKTNRRRRMSRHAAITDIAEFDELDLSPLRQLLNSLLALALLPFCFVTIITLFQRVETQHFLTTFWHSSEFFYFAIGSILMLGWFVTRVGEYFYLYLYVLGHEMTHAMFVYFCFGRISDLKVGLDGGYILTNKSNILIALSPYFIPFWSVIVFAIYNPISLFFQEAFIELAMFFLIGATWTFQILWTAWMIPKDQPDLQEHGTFLSLTVIILANLIVLACLLSGASSDLTILEFAWHWWNNVLDLAEAARKLLPS